MEERIEERSTGTRTCVAVWAALLGLTALTIAAAGLRLGSWSMFACLLIASAKTGLVLWYFMHLKDERPLFRLLLVAPVATITFMILFTFIDIWYR